MIVLFFIGFPFISGCGFPDIGFSWFFSLMVMPVYFPVPGIIITFVASMAHLEPVLVVVDHGVSSTIIGLLLGLGIKY